jgi:hypothetical protein
VRVAVFEGLLIPDGAGYSFAQDLMRDAEYGDQLPGERARCTRLMRPCSRRGPPAPRLPPRSRGTSLVNFTGHAGESSNQVTGTGAGNVEFLARTVDTPFFVWRSSCSGPPHAIVNSGPTDVRF